MDVYYTRDDDWVAVDGGIATIGITDHAQSQLGPVLSVGLPAIGTELARGSEAALIESVKAASDVFSPVSGTIVAVNGALEGDPSLVNTSAEGAGWLVRMALADATELTGLIGRDAYLAGIRPA